MKDNMNIKSWLLAITNKFPCQLIKNTKNFILILAQLIQSAFTLTSNHYAPVI